MEAAGADSNSGWIDNVTISPVPEPYQYGLVGVIGLLGLAVRDRFGRKAT